MTATDRRVCLHSSSMQPLVIPPTSNTTLFIEFAMGKPKPYNYISSNGTLVKNVTRLTFNGEKKP